MVNNILINRLAPPSDSESDEEDERDGEEREKDGLKEVVVVDEGPKVMFHEKPELIEAKTHKVSVMTGTGKMVRVFKKMAEFRKCGVTKFVGKAEKEKTAFRKAFCVGL